MQSCKPKVTDLNPHLLCVLCGGYFVDATTVIECLHSFCRSCIVKYLERNKYCPICDVLVHKSKPLSNIRPDHTLQNIVYKLVPRLFQKEMIMRKEFYNRNKVYLPRDPMSRGVVPDDYHIFAASDAISICLYYECETIDKKNIQEKHKRYLWCPASLTVINLKKLVYIKYELIPTDHHVEFFYQNYLLEDHLTLMDVVYMFDWKRKDPLTITYRILKIEIEPLTNDEISKEENTVESKKDDENFEEKQNDLQQNVVNTELCIEEILPRIDENVLANDKITDSKEVQLEISENGIMKVTNINQSREKIQANVTIEPTDIAKNENPSKYSDINDEKDNDKKKALKVYPGSKVKKTKPKLDTIVEKIKKQGTKYKTLTSPTKHWNPSISKTSVLAKKKELNGIDKKCQKFFKSRDDKKDDDKVEDSLKRLAEVPLMKINPQTLCPIMPSTPAKKPKKPIPKKNTLAHSLALLPVRPTNHNPFTNPLNPFMYGTFPNNSNGDPADTNDFLKAMSELCPPSSAYHNSLPPSVSVLFNPLYTHHRQCQAKKATLAVPQSPDVQKLPANKIEEKSESIEDKTNDKGNNKDECTNNNKGEEKMEVVKEVEKEKT